MKSMNFQYNCPECKEKLLLVENKLHCHNCSCDYEYQNGYAIFTNHNLSYASDNNESVKELLTEIKYNEFETAAEKFLISNNKFRSQLVNTEYDKSVDVIFHGVGKNYSRCLDIKGELGNKAEILSNIFKQVYTIEFDDDYIELQKKRFKERKCTNISITKCDLLKLPFPDNFFDMILCNGVLDNITKFIKSQNQSKAQQQLVIELKRVINEDGCIIFGVSNNNGFKIKWKGSNEEPINDSKVLSNQGFSKYHTVLESNSLKVKSFWAVPSYDIPLYSGEIDDVALKGFFKNLSMLVSALRGGKRQGNIREIILSLFQKMNYPFIKTIVKNYSPSFVFCCWKKKNSNSLENWIKEETGYQNILRMSRHEKILFMLLNTKKEIEKAVYIQRYGHEMPSKIRFFERKFPDVNEPSERIWSVNWLKGRPVNPKNQDEVLATIDWLVEFQKKTKLGRMTKNDAVAETIFIRKELQRFGYKDLDKYDKWLNQYEKYIEKNLNYMVPVHGDFWLPNVLYDNESKKIHIIDWTTYSEKGNPYGDFIWFLCHLMGLSSEDPVLNFRECLKSNGDIGKTIEHIKNKINTYFGFKLDYSLLFRINLMKWMIIQDQVAEKSSGGIKKSQQSVIFLKILDILTEYQ